MNFMERPRRAPSTPLPEETTVSLPDLEIPKKTESETHPSITKASDGFGVSIDGQHSIKIPDRLAKLMRLALAVQQRLDVDPFSINREFQTLTDVVSGMNCHKTSLFLRGDISFDTLKYNASVEAEHNGHTEIISLANENPENIFMFSGDLREFAQSHKDEFPFSIHILALKDNVLVPAHSMIWLGEDEIGNEVCFHKAGPYIDEPFEITTLQTALDPYEEVAAVYLITPVPMEISRKEEEPAI